MKNTRNPILRKHFQYLNKWRRALSISDSCSIDLVSCSMDNGNLAGVAFKNSQYVICLSDKALDSDWKVSILHELCHILFEEATVRAIQKYGARNDEMIEEEVVTRLAGLAVANLYQKIY